LALDAVVNGLSMLLLPAGAALLSALGTMVFTWSWP